MAIAPIRLYRGYAILPVRYQGTRCYRCPELGPDLAVSLRTMYRWIDAEINANRERKGR